MRPPRSIRLSSPTLARCSSCLASCRKRCASTAKRYSRPTPHVHIDELAQPGVIRAALDAAASVYPLVVADVGALLFLPGELPKAVRIHREALLAADAARPH